MIEDNDILEENLKDLDNICDECKNEDESVSQNLILTGFKICKSCRVSKTIFPIQMLLIGKAFILLITKEIDKKAIVKKDKKTIPKDFKFDLRFKICFVDNINAAKIQN